MVLGNQERRLCRELVWYDLQGRKYIEKPTQHGIYILNGKKIMIK